MRAPPSPALPSLPTADQPRPGPFPMPIARRSFLKTTAGATLAAASTGLLPGRRSLRGQVPPPPLPDPARPWFIPFAPAPAPFPDFPDRQAVIAEAQRRSDALEAHVRRWLDGNAPARLPADLLLPGDDPDVIRDFTLVRPEDIRPEQQWVIRPSRPIDFDAVFVEFPDPHCTYLLLPMYAPFNSRVIVKGQFPHARFFDLQITPSFLPEAYHHGYYGVAEVPLVDADVEPKPGSVNPFRPGADRTGSARNYKVVFDLRNGDPVELNPQAFRPPHYRAPGNQRFGGAILHQGPGQFYGAPPPPDWRDRFESGNLWVRYYAPDDARGALAGVPLPKVLYQLPDGRRYFIRCDLATAQAHFSRTQPARTTAPADPAPGRASAGWGKQFGIARNGLSGIAQGSGLLDARYVREFDLGAEGKGENQPAPGNHERGATECTYINYLTASMSLGADMVAVLTGRLPTTPRTRGGEPLMTPAQARYWSLTGYDDLDLFSGSIGAAVQSVMDDEIVTDAPGRYVLVFSRASERPRNATAAHGVTWVNWGLVSAVGWVIRWLSVFPEWSFERAPDQGHLGWATDWASLRYDRNLLGCNDQRGFLGEYQPVVHYLSRGEFEALGDGFIGPARVPVWR